MARAALAAGARGYVLKEGAESALVDAVRAAAGGRSYVDPALGARLMPVAGDTPLSPGTTFAGHRIDGVAGEGGMGVVYAATDLALDRRVALKLIAPAHARDDVFRARFEREARLAASLDHPNLVTVFHAGEEEGRLYVTMRFIEGTDLRALLRSGGPLEPQRAVDLVEQIAGALDEAHAAGLVHRDVKPANVLIRSRGAAAVRPRERPREPLGPRSRAGAGRPGGEVRPSRAGHHGDRRRHGEGSRRPPAFGRRARADGTRMTHG
jgi:hypothetical protein